MKKKIVAMVLAITMIAALVLSSCSAEQKPSESTAPGNSDAAAVESEGPITFTMMYRDSPNYPFDANWPALKAIQAGALRAPTTALCMMRPNGNHCLPRLYRLGRPGGH